MPRKAVNNRYLEEYQDPQETASLLGGDRLSINGRAEYASGAAGFIDLDKNTETFETDKKALVEGAEDEEEKEPYNCWKDFTSDIGFYIIVSLVAFVQGASHLPDLAVQYLFKDELKLDPAMQSVVNGILVVPWVLKPIYGFTTDAMPIFGMRRKPYLFMFGLFGFMCWQVMTWQYHKANIYSVCVLLIGSHLSTAFVNVIAEALIVQRGGRIYNKDGTKDKERIKSEVSKLMTMFWGVEAVTKIFAGFFSGQLLEIIDKKWIFLTTSFFPLSLAIVSLFLGKDEAGERPPTICDTADILWETVKKRAVWGAIVYVFIFAATPSSQSAYFFFLTNGLGFSPLMLGWLQVVEGISSILGLLLFHLFLKNLNYRILLLIGICVGVFAGATPLILVLGLNRDMGIPDVYFLFGDTALLAGVNQITLMPLLIMGAQYCTPEIEATLYSIIMSSLNLGGIASNQIGGLITYLLGITSTDFVRLWILVVICDACQLIPLPLLFVLIEDDKKAGPLAATKPLSGQEGSSSLPPAEGAASYQPISNSD